jgi:hypothetical protein
MLNVPFVMLNVPFVMLNVPFVMLNVVKHLQTSLEYFTEPTSIPLYVGAQ